jgi:acyl-coenzyme A thioesterase PaaI-like protein
MGRFVRKADIRTRFQFCHGNHPTEPVSCAARRLKLVKCLVFAEISITDEKDELIAHGSCTYSIPPRD